MGVKHSVLERLYPGEYYLSKKYYLAKNDMFNQMYTGSNRLPCQIKLDELFNSSVYFESRDAIMPTTESIFNSVLSNYFTIELWMCFQFRNGHVYIDIRNYDSILRSIDCKYRSYPFTPLELQIFRTKLFVHGYVIGTNIQIPPNNKLPSKYQSYVKNNLLPTGMISEIVAYVINPFPYPIPQYFYEKNEKLFLYLNTKYPTVRFSNTNDGCIGFGMEDDNVDFSELISLSQKSGMGRVLPMKETYNLLWSQSPHILGLYYTEIDNNLELIPDLVSVVKEYFTP